MWDDIDFDELFGGGNPDFSEMPFMEQPNFDIGLGMGPDFNPPDWLNQVDFGDNIDQGGGWNPGSGGGLGGLLGAGKGLGGLLGGGKGLGGLLGGAGGLDLTSLLAMLGMGYGGYKGNQASKESAEEIKAASKEANANAACLIGGAQGNFQPYIDTGKNALSDLYALTQQPGLAGKFGPLKAKDMPKMKGSISLAELARK